MARFTTAGGSGDGTPGAPGPAGSNGADGADALWNYTGEYNGGASYAVGDVATYDGQLWYRANANGGNVGDTPSEGFIWNLLAAKGINGADGADGNDGSPGADGAQGDTGSPGLVYLGSYVSGNGYIANIAVVKGSDNNLYIATSSGGLGDPVGNSAEWDIFLPKGVDGEDAVAVTETSFTVNGGSLGTMPTFNGAPLFSGSYVKTGPLVHFQIQVDMDNITSFGTGQYYVDLPFPAKYGYQVREGCLHDISADKQYAIGGHVSAGQYRLNLFFTDTNGQDQEFDHNSPITLAVADNFHVSGTYISN
jgi:hypothetical protein